MGKHQPPLIALLLVVSLATHGRGEEAAVTPDPDSKTDKLVPGKSQTSLPRSFFKTAFRSTIGSFVRHPITTYRLGMATSHRRSATLLEDHLPALDPFALAHASPPPPGTGEFEGHLNKLGLPEPLPGELGYHLDGEAFFTAFEKELAAARESIDIQVYILDNDDVGVHCADLLRARAEEIPVRVIMDDLGSTMAHGRKPPSGLPDGFKSPGDIGNYLVKGNSKVQLRETSNPWLVTDHTKLHLFDRRTAFIGGMNLGRESRHEWHDLMVSLRGPILSALSDDYDSTWKCNGPLGDLALFARKQPLPDLEGPGIPLRILRTDVVHARSDILIAMRQAIRGAKSRIWIEMPYFSSDVIENELKSAASRGVDVRLILPDRANHEIMNAGNLVAARNLMKAGVRVYHYPGMTHLKAMICDGWATVGSANLDTISLRINRELNVSFNDPNLVNELAELVFEPDFQASRLLTPGETKLNLAPLIESIADQL